MVSVSLVPSSKRASGASSRKGVFGRPLFACSRQGRGVGFLPSWHCLGRGGWHLGVFDQVDELLLRVDIQFAVDVMDMGFCRAVGYEKLFGYVLSVSSAYEHAKYFLLASGELVLLDNTVDFALPDGGAAFVF